MIPALADLAENSSGVVELMVANDTLTSPAWGNESLGLVGEGPKLAKPCNAIGPGTWKKRGGCTSWAKHLERKAGQHRRSRITSAHYHSIRILPMPITPWAWRWQRKAGLTKRLPITNARCRLSRMP